MNIIYFIYLIFWFILNSITMVTMLPIIKTKVIETSQSADIISSKTDWITERDKWKDRIHTKRKLDIQTNNNKNYTSNSFVNFISKKLCLHHDSRCQLILQDFIQTSQKNTRQRRSSEERLKMLSRLKHYASSYDELQNISNLLEPLLKEILKAEKNQSTFNSKYFDKMREKLDSYMHSIESVEQTKFTLKTTVPITTVIKTTLESPTTPEEETDTGGFIILGGGGEDDEGSDDSDAHLAVGDDVISGDDVESGDKNTDSYPVSATTPRSQTIIDESVMEEMGLIVVVDNILKEPTATPKLRALTVAPTTTHSTLNLQTTSLTGENGNNEKSLEINYYGACKFCRSSQKESKENIRNDFRKNILQHDFVFLAQKHPSGVFTTILSLRHKRIEFPVHTYIKIRVPLTCDCFVSARNIRYILAGKKTATGLVLNDFYPLYEIENYEQVQEIQKAMEII